MLKPRFVTGVMVIVLFLAGCQNRAMSPTTMASILPTTVVAPPSLTPSPAPNTSMVGEKIIPTTTGDVPRITPKELKALLDAGKDVIIIDTRSYESYEHNHIPGALSIPLAEVEERHSELPKEKKIVLYCT